MLIVNGSTVMTRNALTMATFMLATAIRPTQDQPNSTSDNVRQWSDSPTVPTVRQFRQFRQWPTVPDRGQAWCQTDSCPTVIRQSDRSDSPTVRQCPTVPDSSDSFSDSSDSSDSQGSNYLRNEPCPLRSRDARVRRASRACGKTKSLPYGLCNRKD